MYMVCLILTLLWGAWSRIGIGDYNPQAGVRGLAIGDGRGDDTVRVYAGSDEGNVYELSYNQGIWSKRLVGKVEPGGSIHGLAIGPARNDGTNRLYATSDVKDSISQIHEFTWDGNTWQELLIAPAVSNTFSIKIAKGRNDDTLRIYAGTRHTPQIEGECYELTYRDGEWDHVGMGGQADPTYFHHDLWVGDGRGDDTIRAYSACKDGNVWEYTFRENQWDSRIIDHAFAAWGICIAKGRNDGKNRIYVSCISEGSSGTTTGEIHELTRENNSWTREVIGTTPTYMLGVGAGKGRNDDTIRIYTGTFKGFLHEFTWRNGAWRDFECGDIGTWLWMHDVVVAAGRNDDTLRVYTGAGDGRIHEFTYLPEPRIRVYPDSSLTTLPGIPVTYHLWVVNEGTHPDTIDMADLGTLSDWTAELLDTLGNPLIDSDDDSKPDVGLVLTPDSVPIQVIITPPSSAPLGSTDSTLVFGISSLNPEVYDSALLVTKIAVFMVDPDQKDSITAGETIDYLLTVFNFTGEDHPVDLSITAPSPGWNSILLDTDANPLPDANQDGKMEVGSVASDDSIKFILRITSPNDVQGGTTDTTVVWGESNADPAVRDEATLITMVKTFPLVRIVSDSAATTPAGVPVRYRAEVTNLGNRDDAVNLTRRWTTNWGWTLYDETGTTPLQDTDGDHYLNVGALAAEGGSARVWLELVPDSGSEHNREYTTFLVAFSSHASSVRDSIRLVTRVTNPKAGVVIDPDTSVLAIAGEDNLYPIRVINIGDKPDNFLLSTSSDLDWDVEILDEDGNALSSTGNMGSGETLFVELHITPPVELASIAGSPQERERTERRLLWAVSLTDETVVDSAVIVTSAVPPLDIHNYPNPFKGSTTFIYSIPAEGEATLAIYNRAGEHLITLFENKLHEPGIYTKPWDALSISGQKPAPGVYIYTLQFKSKEGRPRKVVKSALLQP